MIKTLSERTLFRAGEKGYHMYRIPGVLPVGQGALLLTCEARAENKGDWGDIDVVVCRLGADGTMIETLRIGRSQCPPDGTMRTYHNPTLIPDGEGVHLIYHLNYEQAFVISSPDGGKTWGESREITNTFRRFPHTWNVCATGPGHGIQLRSGRLVAAIWIANGAVQADGQTRKHNPAAAGCIYSDDHGVTWHPGALAESDRIISGNETTVAQLPDERLLFCIRNRNEAFYRVLGISENGETFEALWQCPELPDPRCFGSLAAVPDGVLFGNCDTQTERVNVAVKHSTDVGRTWKKVWEVDAVGGYVDIAYADGYIYAFYERGCDALILKKSERVALTAENESKRKEK